MLASVTLFGYFLLLRLFLRLALIFLYLRYYYFAYFPFLLSCFSCVPSVPVKWRFLVS
jgi:hypothetical protein